MHVSRASGTSYAQGLLKHEGKERFGQQFKTWQKAAALFELDNHAPIRLPHGSSAASACVLHLMCLLQREIQSK